MSKEIIQQTLGYFQAILYSMKMARTNGNDWRREIQLTENTANHAIDAIKSALAQPDVMVNIVPPATQRDRWMYEQGRLAERDTRTHAQPGQAEDRCNHCDGTGDVHDLTGEWRGICDCIAKPEREPVGYWQGNYGECGAAILYEFKQESAFGRTYRNIPVYTEPSKREFIDLTQYQIAEIFRSMPGGLKGFSVEWGWIQFSDALIAALKEKNAC